MIQNAVLMVLDHLVVKLKKYSFIINKIKLFCVGVSTPWKSLLFPNKSPFAWLVCPTVHVSIVNSGFFDSRCPSNMHSRWCRCSCCVLQATHIICRIRQSTHRAGHRRLNYTINYFYSTSKQLIFQFFYI
jgi:hypothetical protein